MDRLSPAWWDIGMTFSMRLQELSKDYVYIFCTSLYAQPHWRYLLLTHPHTTPISSLPQQCAVGAGQLRQSIDCSVEEGEKKEPQAMSSGRGEDLSKITAPGAFLPHTGKARAQTAATALHIGPHRPLRGRMLTL